MESDSLSPNVNVNDILKNFSIDSIDEAAINEAQQKMLDFNRRNICQRFAEIAQSHEPFEMID